MHFTRERIIHFGESYLKSLSLTLAWGIIGIIPGAFIGYNLTSTKKPNIELQDIDRDGSVDAIIDENWKIIIINNPSYILEQIKTENQTYRVCIFPKETKIPFGLEEKYFSQTVRPILEDCINKN